MLLLFTYTFVAVYLLRIGLMPAEDASGNVPTDKEVQKPSRPPRQEEAIADISHFLSLEELTYLAGKIHVDSLQAAFCT